MSIAAQNRRNRIKVCARSSTCAVLVVGALLAAPVRAQEGGTFVPGPFGMPIGPFAAPAAPGAPAPVPAAPLAAAPDLRTLVRAAFAAQPAGRGLDRHGLRSLLVPPTPSPGVETLIVAFEGTGAFEPRLAPTIMKVAADLNWQISDGDAIVDTAEADLARRERREVHWSGLLSGPMGMLLEQPELTGRFDWASFPSEEAEVLAGLDSITPENIRRILKDAARSTAGLPLGVTASRDWVTTYLAAWPEDRPKPRVVVLAHSSGTRTAVKALEELGKKGISADLVFSIDPVRAAHEALKELLPQMIGQGAHYNVRKVGPIDWVLDRVGAPKPVLPRVWRRDHPDHLYKPRNAGRWVSVYQMDDELGLKIPPHHGIQGSRLKDADHQEMIGGLGQDAHGPIAYNKRTLELLAEELKKLRPAKPQ